MEWETIEVSHRTWQGQTSGMTPPIHLALRGALWLLCLLALAFGIAAFVKTGAVEAALMIAVSLIALALCAWHTGEIVSSSSAD